MPQKFRTTKVSRLSKLINLSATVVGKSIVGVITAKEEIETRIAQAKALTQALSELKGAAMKVGQMLSIQGESFLPKEITDILSQLQNAAPAFSGKDIREIVEKELGDKMLLIKHFDEKA